MSNDLALPNQNNIWSADEFDSGNNIIRGTLLKFRDGHWFRGSGAGEEEVPLRSQFVVVDLQRVFQRWENSKPAEHKVIQPHERLPGRETLSHTDMSKWELGPDGQPRDPWQFCRLVVLQDPKTSEILTYTTSSKSGLGCVSALKDQVRNFQETYDW
jgi:hypothetical protein